MLGFCQGVECMCISYIFSLQIQQGNDDLHVVFSAVVEFLQQDGFFGQRLPELHFCLLACCDILMGAMHTNRLALFIPFHFCRITYPADRAIWPYDSIFYLAGTGLLPDSLCLANRHRGVRAVLAGTPATTRQAVAAVGANVLVVEPEGKSVFEMQRTAAELYRNWPRSCPRHLKKLLD